MTTMSLRPAQRRILEYVDGKLAISAVPGAGKTFILTQLAVRLVRDLGVSPRQILILTYMRSAAATFKQRIASALAEQGLTAYGLQAMTIHAFCLSILKRYHATRGNEAEGDRPLQVLSEPEQRRILMAGMQPYDADPARSQEWRKRYSSTRAEYDPLDAVARNARKLISAAKHFRLTPDQLEELLSDSMPEVPFLFRHYQDVQAKDGLVDFDDQVQGAIALLKTDPELLDFFHRRYAFVLEDEAQDSTPSQHELISLLTDRGWGGAGNLVRVGDPNQAITTTFTFNDPTYFRQFCRALEEDGRHERMDESSRSARPVIELANALVTYTAAHPVPAIASAFETQAIRPATAGHPNPEPLGRPTWTVYASPEQEREQVLLAVRRFLQDRPQATAAVLLFGNDDVKAYAETARFLGIPLFEGAFKSVTTVDVLTVLDGFLDLLGRTGPGAEAAFRGLVSNWLVHRKEGPKGDWESADAAKRFLRETPLDALVYPEFGLPPARPRGLPEADYGAILVVAGLVRQMLEARHLPAEELLPSVVEAFFEDPDAPLIAAKALRAARRQLAILDPAPGNPWEGIRKEFALLRPGNKRQELLSGDPTMAKPEPGQLQILTMHRSKGAEFEAVWLPALGFTPRGGTAFPWMNHQAWVGDVAPMVAEAMIRRGNQKDAPERAVLEAEAKAALIAERLRLLYVGITRAERALHLSCSYGRETGEPAPRHLLYLGSRCADPEGRS